MGSACGHEMFGFADSDIDTAGDGPQRIEACLDHFHTSAQTEIIGYTG